jgi:hypothetical protein
MMELLKQKIKKNTQNTKITKLFLGKPYHATGKTCNLIRSYHVAGEIIAEETAP